MIERCPDAAGDEILSVINDAARAYQGAIPADCMREPYMTREELRHEIGDGIVFFGYREDGHLVGVMGIQEVKDVTLIRHAYVRTARQHQGIGSRLLSHLSGLTGRPLLIGTWADAGWAIRFYARHGISAGPAAEKDRLLQTYWSVPERQMATSVVLADQRWFQAQKGRQEL